SGPQNRDEELMGHKPFLVWADYLTRNGIAVLRFDDRGTAASKGNFKTAITPDFASDVEAAVQYLKTRKEIDKKKIGLIGHSEGGIIAPMVAAGSKDISFIVLLAGTGVPGNEILLLQQELIGRANGASEAELLKSKLMNKGAFDIIINTVDNSKRKADLSTYLNQVYEQDTTLEIPQGMTKDELISKQVSQLTSPWMVYFITHDPAPVLQKVKCAVLAVNGDKDLQVPAQVNLDAIKKALEKGGNKKVTTRVFPGLNHLFQECKTGSPSEYAGIEQTISPVVLEEVTQWIVKQTK
ncbi:MAG TPA: alpha/beta fold hydrolase, partial [Bacteroidales bacterium]|nr:alpha/beta fold hydrolase [Bacteroidales bacterium]